MRNWFLFALRLLGVLLFLSGCLILFNLALAFLCTMMSSAAASPVDPIAKAFAQSAAESLWPLFTAALAFPAVNGVALLWLGVYLMKSSNPLFLRVCYPPDDQPPVPAPADTAPRSAPAPRDDPGRFKPRQ